MSARFQQVCVEPVRFIRRQGNVASHVHICNAVGRVPGRHQLKLQGLGNLAGVRLLLIDCALGRQALLCHRNAAFAVNCNCLLDRGLILKLLQGVAGTGVNLETLAQIILGRGCHAGPEVSPGFLQLLPGFLQAAGKNFHVAD